MQRKCTVRDSKKCLVLAGASDTICHVRPVPAARSQIKLTACQGVRTREKGIYNVCIYIELAVIWRWYHYECICECFWRCQDSRTEPKFILVKCLCIYIYNIYVCINKLYSTINLLWTKFIFRRFSGHNLRYSLFVYRLIGATLIGNFYWWSLLKI